GFRHVGEAQDVERAIPKGEDASEPSAIVFADEAPHIARHSAPAKEQNVAYLLVLAVLERLDDKRRIRAPTLGDVEAIGENVFAKQRVHARIGARPPEAWAD